jgi:hypothetical protein
MMPEGIKEDIAQEFLEVSTYEQSSCTRDMEL